MAGMLLSNDSRRPCNRMHRAVLAKPLDMSLRQHATLFLPAQRPRVNAGWVRGRDPRPLSHRGRGAGRCGCVHDQEEQPSPSALSPGGGEWGSGTLATAFSRPGRAPQQFPRATLTPSPSPEGERGAGHYSAGCLQLRLSPFRRCIQRSAMIASSTLSMFWKHIVVPDPQHSGSLRSRSTAFACSVLSQSAGMVLAAIQFHDQLPRHAHIRDTVRTSASVRPRWEPSLPNLWMIAKPRALCPHLSPDASPSFLPLSRNAGGGSRVGVHAGSATHTLTPGPSPKRERGAGRCLV